MNNIQESSKSLILSEKPSIVWEANLNANRLDSMYYHSDFINNEKKIGEANCFTLKEIITQGQYGILPDSDDYIDDNGDGIYLIRGTDLRNNFIYQANLITVPKKYFNKKYAIENGDLLILVKGVTLDKEWSSSIATSLDKPAIFNGSIFRLKLKDDIDEYYTVAFMSTEYFLKQKRRAISNTGIYYNDLDMIYNFKIPIPPCPIQEYIGNKVRRAEELREEAMRFEVDVRNTFQVTTGLTENGVNLANKNYTYVLPKDIGNLLGPEVYREEYVQNQRLIKSAGDYTNLHKCFQLIANGLDSRQYSKEYSTPYFRVTNINLWGIDRENVEYINFPLEKVPKKQRLANGDLLLTRKGSFGIPMEVTEEDLSGVISSEIYRIKVKSNWDAGFLAYFLNTSFGQKQFKQYSTGSTMKGISQQSLEEVLVPKVPFKDQVKIGDYVRTIKSLYDHTRKLINEAKQDVEDLIEGRFDESKIKSES